MKKTGKVQTYEERQTANRLAEIKKRQKEHYEDSPEAEIDNWNKQHK